MGRFAALVSALLLVLALSPVCQAQDKYEFFAGYSFAHATVPLSETQLCPGPPCPVATFSSGANLNGWEAAGVYSTGRWVGFEADFSGDYGSTEKTATQFGTSSGVSTHLQTYLFGPQFSWRGKVTFFAHTLVGLAHESDGSGPVGSGAVVLGASHNCFAAALGVGIDFKLTPMLSVRAVQIDSLLTKFSSSTQTQPRVSAGLVFHF